MLLETFSKYFLIILILNYGGVNQKLCVNAEIISMSLATWTIGSAVLGGIYNWNAIKDKTVCRFTECCTSEYIPYDLDGLKRSLSEKMFGQPLVNELVTILTAHKESLLSEKKSNQKPLVISLHGWSGVGKNYAVNIIAEAMYKKGVESNYVNMFMAKKDFNCASLEKSKSMLFEKLEALVKRCPRSLIVFDEIHDMCPTVLDAIKPMLDHHNKIDGVDYRDSIFIFISNIGGHEISSKLLELYNQGIKRNEVQFHNFEPIIRRTAYHTGGFEKSSAIAQHLIDHYIPFLPLEQQHVEKCARAEFKSYGIHNPTEEMMADALSIITYGPTEDQPIFANNGCKRFIRHIPYVIQKFKQKNES